MSEWLRGIVGLMLSEDVSAGVGLK